MKAQFTRSAVIVVLAAALAAVSARDARARSSADSLVTGFDLEGCLHARAIGFEITRIAPVWGVGLEALAVLPATREILHLAAGVYGSNREAADALAARVSDSSIRLEHGSLSGKSLGNASWSADLTIVFQRDNVLIQVFGSSRERVQALAETLDRELVSGENGDVERGGRVSRPTLSGVRTPAGNVPVGSTVEILLRASTRTGREVRYTYHPEGGELLGGDPPVPLVFRAHAAGNHTLRFAAVDTHCVMSSVLVFPVTVEETGR